MAWLQAHWGMLSVLLVAVLDFVMALSPGLKANGIVHAVYLLLGGKETPSLT